VPYDARSAGDDHEPGELAARAPEAVALRDAVDDATRALRRVRRLIEQEPALSGELGGLIGLLGAIDTGHAAAVGLTARIERDGVAERRSGLSLEGLLAMQTRLTYGDRRTLTNAAAALRDLPHLAAAFQAGRIGWAQLRRIVAELRDLDAAARAELDAGFADADRLAQLDPDQVVDELAAAAGRHRAAKERDRTVRQIEHRFLHVQPALDGALTGYFELDPEGGAIFLAGLEAAAPDPSAGPNDVTRDAVADDSPAGDSAADDPVADEPATDACGPDGQPAFADPVAGRTRARQRADALVRLGEWFLAGRNTDGSPRRARPSMTVVCDVATLTGDDDHAVAARLLLQTAGVAPVLTPEATRRLGSDADLRFLVTDGGDVLGITEPTARIPAKLRAAIAARDQGCRFPGCTAPITWCDLHHVRPRELDGETTADNLVAVCRRHHTALTEGRWRLRMDDQAIVTVTRGRRTATGRPPALRGHPRPEHVDTASDPPAPG
jgi:hypothetical protein